MLNEGKGLDRRTFIRTAAAASALGGLTLAGCAPSAPAPAPEKSEPEVKAPEPTTKWVDAVSSASVTTKKYTSLPKEELIPLINSFQAECVVATTNEDATPNVAVFAGGVVIDDYLCFTWTDNQSKANIKRSNLAMIVFDQVNMASETKEGRHKGGKVRVEYVPDKEVLDQIRAKNDKISEAALVVKIVEVLPVD